MNESSVLAGKLIVLADESESEDVDDGCVLLCGILRDCAYRIKRHADRGRGVSMSTASAGMADGGDALGV